MIDDLNTQSTVIYIRQKHHESAEISSSLATNKSENSSSKFNFNYILVLVLKQNPEI